MCKGFMIIAVQNTWANFSPVSEVHDYSTRRGLHNFKIPFVNNINKSTFYYNAVQD